MHTTRNQDMDSTKTSGHDASNKGQSQPYHNSSVFLAKQLLAGRNVRYLNFQLGSLAQLAAITTVPPAHRDDVKQFWSGVKKQIKANSPGCSMLSAEIDKALLAIDQQKVESTNGADATTEQVIAGQHKPGGTEKPWRDGFQND